MAKGIFGKNLLMSVRHELVKIGFEEVGRNDSLSSIYMMKKGCQFRLRISLHSWKKSTRKRWPSVVTSYRLTGDHTVDALPVLAHKIACRFNTTSNARLLAANRHLQASDELKAMISEGRE